MRINRIQLTLVREECHGYGPGTNHKMGSGDDVYKFFSFLIGAVQEELHALYLDPKNKIIGYHQVAKGSNNQACISPADILRPALLTNAVSIILAHNHPSGDPTPSQIDRDVTRKLQEAAYLFQVKLLDHVVIGRNGYWSIIHDQEHTVTELKRESPRLQPCGGVKHAEGESLF